MALLAAPPELPVVRIVLGVAVVAALTDRRDRLPLGRGAGVTRCTSHAHMGTGERVVRLAVVVEVPGEPMAGVVARLASLAQGGAVHIVLLVAGHALARGASETFRFMA